MILALVISVLTLPCLAVEPGQSYRANEASAMEDPITRWVELYQQIYLRDSTRVLDRPQLNSILQEMSKIEHSDHFSTKLRMADKLHGVSINHFDHVIEKLYETSFLAYPGATITDILMHTLDEDLNDCSGKYFKELDEIYIHFDKTPMANVLLSSREEQFHTCWNRMMNLLSSTCMLLGTRVRNPLDELLELLKPMSNESIGLNAWPARPEYRKESNWLAEKIVEFLRKKTGGDTLRNVEEKFEHFVRRPCAMLHEKTLLLTIDTMSMMKGEDEDYISDDQAKILNRFLMCHRIMTDTFEISFRVLKLSKEQNVTTSRGQHSSPDVINVDGLQEDRPNKRLKN